MVPGDTFDHVPNHVKALLRQREQLFRCGVIGSF